MNKNYKTVIIALGSNLDDPVNQILTSIDEIKNNNKIIFIAQSKLHKTKPVGYLDQPDFINAVIKIQTTLLPLELLRFLQNIENIHHRKRDIKWGPRTLDLDIIDYDNGLKINTDELTLPHPRAHERGFVMEPWKEIF